MRRLELLIEEIRRSTDNEDTSGISDLDIVQYLNDAQDRIQSRIASQFPNVFFTQTTIDLVASQEAYDLPTDIYLGTRIANLEYLYSETSNDYAQLPSKTLADRSTSYESDFPAFYIRRNNDILINPIPQVARTDGLRLTYQHKLRTLDIRRGEISSASKTGTTLNSLTLDLTPTLTKDSGVVAAASDVLNKIDYISVVDRDGVNVLKNIPIDSYNSSTGVVTVTSGFTTTVDASTFVGEYVVGGTNATSHSDLFDVCERYLIVYAKLKLLERDGNQLEANYQIGELREIEKDIIESYQVPEEDRLILPIDIDWN